MPHAMPNTRADVEAVSLLAEPVRDSLYRYVVRSGTAVGRDEAAAALRITRALAAFHLDRLVAGGLLVAEYRRLSGRSGPGAGRPSKLYRRGPDDVGVSLPGRRYEIPAQLFADTIEGLAAHLPPTALIAAARRMGEAIGSAARSGAGNRPSRTRLRGALIATLEERDYQPREQSGEIRLANCPYQTLVAGHRPLVCGMNLALIDGMISGLGTPQLTAHRDLQSDECCVAVEEATHA
jgi:predicted ArsR family transcriptional regulator